MKQIPVLWVWGVLATLTLCHSFVAKMPLRRTFTPSAGQADYYDKSKIKLNKEVIEGLVCFKK